MAKSVFISSSAHRRDHGAGGHRVVGFPSCLSGLNGCGRAKVPASYDPADSAAFSAWRFAGVGKGPAILVSPETLSSIDASSWRK
jgi:hypothetical protein